MSCTSVATVLMALAMPTTSYRSVIFSLPLMSDGTGNAVPAGKESESLRADLLRFDPSLPGTIRARRVRATRRRSASTCPFAHFGHVHGKHRPVGRLRAVSRVLLAQEREGVFPFLALVKNACAAAEANPPETAQSSS
jgi:hypothetical protein